MNNFLLLNDFSPEAEHAISSAIVLAGQLNAQVLVWNVNAAKKQPVIRELVLVNSKTSTVDTVTGRSSATLKSHPLVKYLHEEETHNRTVHQIVDEYKVQLIIKGVSGSLTSIDAHSRRILANTYCPLLLIPRHVTVSQLKNIVYMADLRFCRREITAFLKNTAITADADVTIAHIAAKDIPDMVDDYAAELYQQTVSLSGCKSCFRFSHIKERDIKKAADVMVSMLKTDLLVMAYARFHFIALTSDPSPENALDRLTAPLMLFPS